MFSWIGRFARQTICVGVLIASWQPEAEAHVKWFVDTHDRSALAHAAKPALFAQWSPLNVSLIAIAVLAAIGTIVAATMAVPLGRAVAARLKPLDAWAPTAVGVLLGATLVTAAFRGHFVALDLDLAESGVTWLGPLEGLLGILLIAGLFTRWIALILLVGFGAAFPLFGLGDALDLLVLPGIACYLIAFGRGRLAADRLIERHPLSLAAFSRALVPVGLPLMRIFAGSALMVLAISEKLGNPQLSLRFIEDHRWINFTGALHIPLTDDVFVMCAGLVELLVGFLLAIGVFTRILVVVVAILFSITFATLGFTELYGHLAYVGVALALFVQGGGSLALPVWLRDAWPDHEGYRSSVPAEVSP